jgi:outer membrane protein assembly factor BamB
MHRLLRCTVKLGTVLVVFIAVQTSAADWPQFGGRNRDSATDRNGIMRRWPKGGPEKLWHVKLGRGFGAPVVADGEAYLLDRKVGTSQTLRCFSRASGKEKWSYTWASKGGVPVSGSRAQPLVNEEYVFAVGARGWAYCFNRSTHKPVWKVNLLKKYGADLPRWGIAQSPLGYKDRVILAPNGKEAGVVALSQDTGEEVWTSKPIGKRKRGSYTSPMLATIGGVRQILYTTPDVTVGIRASDGQVLWRYRDWYCKIPIVSPVHVSDGRVLITGGYGAGTQMFRVHKSADGFKTTTLWKTDACNCQIHQPLVYKNHIYLMGNSNKRSDGMMCFDMQGNLQWKTGRDPNFGRGGMIRVGDRIFALDDTTGDLVLIKPSPRGYQELGRRTYLSGPEKWAPLALADGKLLIRDQKKMVCVDVRGK